MGEQVLLAAAWSIFRRGVKSYREAPGLLGGSEEAPGIDLYKPEARLDSS